mmetsp:Transcript_36904/g.95696  ORF Transcript_36904/g.95696 Transcript_36904/m.95696 type:complete len:495 (-) Transcript_36904:291-1775(-)
MPRDDDVSPGEASYITMQLRVTARTGILQVRRLREADANLAPSCPFGVAWASRSICVRWSDGLSGSGRLASALGEQQPAAAVLLAADLLAPLRGGGLGLAPGRRPAEHRRLVLLLKRVHDLAEGGERGGEVVWNVAADGKAVLKLVLVKQAHGVVRLQEPHGSARGWEREADEAVVVVPPLLADGLPQVLVPPQRARVGAGDAPAGQPGRHAIAILDAERLDHAVLERGVRGVRGHAFDDHVQPRLDRLVVQQLDQLALVLQQSGGDGGPVHEVAGEEELCHVDHGAVVALLGRINRRRLPQHVEERLAGRLKQKGAVVEHLVHDARVPWRLYGRRCLRFPHRLHVLAEPHRRVKVGNPAVLLCQPHGHLVEADVCTGVVRLRHAHDLDAGALQRLDGRSCDIGGHKDQHVAVLCAVLAQRVDEDKCPREVAVLVHHGRPRLVAAGGPAYTWAGPLAVVRLDVDDGRFVETALAGHRRHAHADLLVCHHLHRPL